MNFVQRSEWAAHRDRSTRMHSDWNYTKIAIHHAGRSFACGPGALQLQDIQDMQMSRSPGALDDIGYHYALDCLGNVFEGRDIRFQGENVHNHNTGVFKFTNVLFEFFHIHTLGGHREFPGQPGEGKICPGNIGLTLVSELRKSTGLRAP